MRKPVQVGMFVVLAGLLIATVVLFSKLQGEKADYASVKASEEATQQRYAKTIDAIAEIQDSLNAISFGNDVNMKSGSLASEQQISGADRTEALDRIATLRTSIMRSKERIAQLESSLKASGNHVAGLQKMVANLKQSVAEKEELVTELSTRVDSLQTEVTGLATKVEENEATIAQRDQSIEDKRKELATVYYVVGSKKDLTQKGALVAKGGVLGMGKTVVPASTANLSAFNTIDTDEQTVIEIDSAKAKVVSAQPADSYELTLVDGKMQLHILNPSEFRKIKQVVIMTA